MKRFKLSRKEKLLYATPLLLPLLVLVWPLVKADSLDGKLKELAGPNSVDCGLTSSNSINDIYKDQCAVEAFKAGKPFLVRYEINGLTTSKRSEADAVGLVRTPQGQVYRLFYFRRNWHTKAVLRQSLCADAKIQTYSDQSQRIAVDLYKEKIIQVWR